MPASVAVPKGWNKKKNSAYERERARVRGRERGREKEREERGIWVEGRDMNVERSGYGSRAETCMSKIHDKSKKKKKEQKIALTMLERTILTPRIE